MYCSVVVGDLRAQWQQQLSRAICVGCDMKSVEYIKGHCGLLLMIIKRESHLVVTSVRLNKTEYFPG